MVLLPQPLPPMIAKMEPGRIEKLTSRWITRGPKATVRFRTCNRHSEFSLGSTPSNPKRIEAEGENRVQRDNSHNAGDDSAGCGAAHIRGAASRPQSDMTARQRDKRPES